MRNLFGDNGAAVPYFSGEAEAKKIVGNGGVNSELIAVMDAIGELKRRFDGTETVVRSIRQDIDRLKVSADVLNHVSEAMTKNAEKSVLLARTVLAGIDQDTYKMLVSLVNAIDKCDVDKLTDVAKQARSKVKQYEATGIISSKVKEIKVVVPNINVQRDGMYAEWFGR